MDSNSKALDILNTDERKLKEKADKARDASIGRDVFLRAIIEISNLCEKNCFYCGIRRDNNLIKRYSMTEKEIAGLAKQAFDCGYYSIVLQSGEITSPKFTSFIQSVVYKIKEITQGKMSVVLSLGEQDRKTYKLWKSAGADRYLLRIETSSPRLYAQMHPNDKKHSIENRMECLYALKKLGYQLGTGILIGVPGQKTEDIANDIDFFTEIDIDMLGMGPYIPTRNTPLYEKREAIDIKENFFLALKTIATCRILMPDINIASTTALEAIDPNGKIQGILWGANVIMPNITPISRRADYKLYPYKPNDTGLEKIYLEHLRLDLSKHNFNLKLTDKGDPLHYLLRYKTLSDKF